MENNEKNNPESDEHARNYRRQRYRPKGKICPNLNNGLNMQS